MTMSVTDHRAHLTSAEELAATVAITRHDFEWNACKDL